MRPRRRAGRPLLALAGAVAAAMVVLLAGAQAATGSVCSTGGWRPWTARITPVPSLEPGATELEWAALVQAQRQRGGVAELAAWRIAVRCADLLRRRATGSVSPRSWRPAGRPAPSTTSPSRRSPPTRHVRVPIRRGASRRSALASMPWRRSTSPRGRSGSANGATWHAAGVEARRRVAAAGYDLGGGDTWAVNEFSSAVRRGDGSARANAREFVRGLFEGDGALPPDPRCRLDDRRLPAHTRPLDLQGKPSGLAPGRGVLDGHERLRQRLLAGELRGHA